MMLLLAQPEPPQQLASWVGAIVLGAIVTGLVGYIGGALKRGPMAERQADAEFRAQVLAQLQVLMGKLTEIFTLAARQDERLGHLTGRIEAVEKRADAQGTMHRAEMEDLRERLEVLRGQIEAVRRDCEARRG